MRPGRQATPAQVTPNCSLERRVHFVQQYVKNVYVWFVEKSVQGRMHLDREIATVRALGRMAAEFGDWEGARQIYDMVCER